MPDTPFLAHPKKNVYILLLKSTNLWTLIFTQTFTNSMDIVQLFARSCKAEEKESKMFYYILQLKPQK